MIQLYLDRHPNIEDNESQRLHDELLNLYNKHVAKDVDKHATFLAALKQLRPAIKGTARLLEWWDLLVRPTLDSLGQEKAVVSDAGAVLLSVLVYDEDEDDDGEKARASALFTGKLLELYLDKTRLLTGDGPKVLPEDERYRFVSNHLESLLVSFGRKRPKVNGVTWTFYAVPQANTTVGLPDRHRRSSSRERVSLAGFEPIGHFRALSTPPSTPGTPNTPTGTPSPMPHG